MTSSLGYWVFGVLLIFVPDFSRREFLFAVPVAPGFRESAQGKRSLWGYRIIVAAAFILHFLLDIGGKMRLREADSMSWLVGLFLVSSCAFCWQHYKLRPYRIRLEQAREATLSPQENKLPRFVWLHVGAFLIPLLEALFVYRQQHSPSLASSWTLETSHHVYGMMIYSELCALAQLGMIFAVWYGSRRTLYTRMTLGICVAMGYYLVLVVALVPFKYLYGIDLKHYAAAPILLMLAVLIYFRHKIAGLDSSPDPTPAECWKAGIIYFNRDDSAIFVEKRSGFGYTFNFANPLAWAVLAVIAITSVVSVSFLT